MEKRAYRIGIDVGGTFTKAVLIDNDTLEVVERASVLTTHTNARGVARGVIDVFRQVLARSGVEPASVVFIAHSTTQATNALLEGDVARVGVIGIASEQLADLARQQSRIDAIELAPGRSLRPDHRFLTTETLTEAAALAAIDELRAQGAEAIVATSAFAVDDGSCEQAVQEAGRVRGIPVSPAHEVSGLYGLATRTRTAVVNASILPRMIQTAAMTELSIREAGIAAPLMIMRGDGGVMDTDEMRRRPAMTMLSGPAASVAGALMHLRVSDGIYFEVGGTSTNIGVIRNGQPTVKYARLGGHDTYVSSLDVRVIGVAGGSMVRVREGALFDVGPRSAHIAGLPYAAFGQADVLREGKIELFRPAPDDPPDYVAVRATDGSLHAITLTCAANVLGYAKPGMHACGDAEAARAAMLPLASMLGRTVEEVARSILEAAARKIESVVLQLIGEYGLDRDQAMLVGQGGGAGALVPFLAERLELASVISKDAEVISSIGVALALVRDVVERLIPDPQPEDLRALKREAFEAVVRQGAAPETVEVRIEIDPYTQRVRAVATGACGMRTRVAKAITEGQACRIAAESMAVPVDAIRVAAATDSLFVLQAVLRDAGRPAVRVVDLEGTIRLRRSAATVTRSVAQQGLATLRHLLGRTTSKIGGGAALADIIILLGSHIVELARGGSAEQALALARTEFEGVPADTTVVFIAAGGAHP
ncbi:N-methylhydantoinase A/oxoprolinase/acetone carboxylase, beta subunit [Enhydrobacter aerosaccus]|uniref:N-methylhydantoinase A/oxoprolinase/acetone carboxylase, beta subunit n=1 Tax=Enhydrobacter aerosaccus TaxID=225324 RepID=A0A1T4NWW7_9HYPH|nr:hydantoinase/oxoprolinase family protein [Enhydrobacter aerosaccus]SJZ83536.1 N-methylhydantoinase A/oxoprolinase/acetone carboxylase, beta subunit [Enhydrobacter aerosaccus]